MKEHFHITIVKTFMQRIFREAIMEENLLNDGEEFHYDQLWYITEEGAVETEVEPRYRDCVKAVKGNEKYFIPLMFLDSLPFVVTASKPCYDKKADKKVWRQVTGVQRIMLPATSNYSVREFVNDWNTVEHSNEKTRIFLNLLALSTRYMGTKCCIASAPAAMKNMNFNIVAEIMRDVLVIGTPSKARFETALFYNKCINLNEMAKPKAEEADAIRDLIIWLGDQSERYNKQSLASKRRLESLDIGNKSCIITYNRKRCLKESATFFDDLWSNPGAIRARYPQFLITGKVLEKVKKYSDHEANEAAQRNDLLIKEMVAKLSGFATAVRSQIHRYEVRTLNGFEARQHTNIQGLLDTIDAYCESQKEFDDWCTWLTQRKADYEYMVKNEIQEGKYDDVPEQVSPLMEDKTHTPKISKLEKLTTPKMDSGNAKLELMDLEVI